MRLTSHLILGRRRARRQEAVRPSSPPAPAPPPKPRFDPPQDAAFYSCVCGFAWTDAVTTSVGCPHCGTAQAW